MMTRRTVLAASLATAQAQIKKIRIGFLGGSHSHARSKYEVTTQSPHFEVVGVVEDDPAVRAQYEKAGARILSREALLGDASVEAIAVESEVQAHGRDGADVLRAGKHLHLEKPPAHTMAAMAEIVWLAREKRAVLQMGYMWRHNPAVNKAMEAARNGWLGDVYQVKAQMNTLVDARRRPDWALFSGGQMFEQGAHLIDILVRLMGKPQQVTSVLRRDGKFDDDMKDNTVAVLEWPRAFGVVLASTLQPNANAHRFVEILGSNGTAVVRPIEPATLSLDLVKAAGPYPAGRQPVAVGTYTRYVDDFEEFAGAIRGTVTIPITLEQELAVEETILRASRMLS
jgi:predicted dehydrogenase